MSMGQSGARTSADGPRGNVEQARVGVHHQNDEAGAHLPPVGRSAEVSQNGATVQLSLARYYADDLVTIYCGDARQLAPLIDADVLVTDPPYGIDLKAKTTNSTLPAATTLYQDDPEHVRGLIADVISPLIDRLGRALIFPGPNMMFAYPEPRAVGTVYLPRGTGRSPWGFQLSHPIFYYGKDPYLVDGRGGRPNGFWDTPIVGEVEGHPCPKPIKWMRWAVERASRPLETILDPFAGSGTTLIAARERERHAIGIEIEERYCELAVRRLAQGVLGMAC